MNVWQIALDVMNMRHCDTLEITAPWRIEYIRHGSELVGVIPPEMQRVARENGLRIIAADYRRETLLVMRR